MRLSFSFKGVQERFSSRRFLFFWYRHYKFLFFLLFLVVLSIGGWKWYYSLYEYAFTEEEKKEYIESYFKETVFKETKFREVVGNLRERTRMHGETFESTRDISKGKGIRDDDERIAPR